VIWKTNTTPLWHIDTQMTAGSCGIPEMETEEPLHKQIIKYRN